MSKGLESTMCVSGCSYKFRDNTIEEARAEIDSRRTWLSTKCVCTHVALQHW